MKFIENIPVFNYDENENEFKILNSIEDIKDKLFDVPIINRKGENNIQILGFITKAKDYIYPYIYGDVLIWEENEKDLSTFFNYELVLNKDGYVDSIYAVQLK